MHLCSYRETRGIHKQGDARLLYWVCSKERLQAPAVQEEGSSPTHQGACRSRALGSAWGELSHGIICVRANNPNITCTGLWTRCQGWQQERMDPREGTSLLTTRNPHHFNPFPWTLRTHTSCRLTQKKTQTWRRWQWKCTAKKPFYLLFITLYFLWLIMHAHQRADHVVPLTRGTSCRSSSCYINSMDLQLYSSMMQFWR